MSEPPSQKRSDEISVAKSTHAELRGEKAEGQAVAPASGLTKEEAQRRLAQYGYNELPEKRRNPWLEFLAHFWGPIPWMIEAAAILVTGDQVVIGKEIARQVGLGTNILDAGVFDETSHHQSGQLAEAIERADGFAQVFPEHKFHIVETLQKRGHDRGWRERRAGVEEGGCRDCCFRRHRRRARRRRHRADEPRALRDH